MKSLTCVLLLAGIAWGQQHTTLFGNDMGVCLIENPKMATCYSEMRETCLIIPYSGPVYAIDGRCPNHDSELPITARHLPVLPLQEAELCNRCCEIRKGWGICKTDYASDGTIETLPIRPDGGPGIGEHYQATITEPVDAPAILHEPIEVENWRDCPGDTVLGASTHWPFVCIPTKEYSCEDSSRFLLQAENKTWHCVKF